MKKTFYLLGITLLFCNCTDGGSGSTKLKSLAETVKSVVGYESDDVNAVQQALPTVMVIPSDNLLQSFGCTSFQEYDGKRFLIRDYQQFLLKAKENRTILSVIQDAFRQSNFPLTDFEQSLKNLNTESAYDLADGVAKDAKTVLLSTCQPDIILELDYSTSGNSVISHDYKNQKLSYTLSAIDAYTSKVESSISSTNLGGESVEDCIRQSLMEQMDKFKNDIQGYFSDIIYRGREVTVRFTLSQDAPIKLSDNSIEGDTYTDWLVDYMKSHTVKGAYKMQINSGAELSFTNVRIKMLNEDGTQYGVYDWARDCMKTMKQQLGLVATNNSQGLGSVVINIKGY